MTNIFASIDAKAKSLLPEELRYDGVSTVVELVTETTDTKKAINVLQDSILSFYLSNMSERDDLYTRALTHLKAVKTKELLEVRAAVEATSSNKTKDMTKAIVSPVVFNYPRQDTGLLKFTKEKVADFMKTLYVKDNETVAVEACKLFFDLCLYDEINEVFNRYCDPQRRGFLPKFTDRVSRFFDDNSALNQRMRNKHRNIFTITNA